MPNTLYFTDNGRFLYVRAQRLRTVDPVQKFAGPVFPLHDRNMTFGPFIPPNPYFPVQPRRHHSMCESCRC